MQIYHYTGGSLATNSYIIDTGTTVIVIDATEGVANFLQSKSLTATHLLLTHQHFDHIEDAYLLQQKGANIYAMQPYSEELSLKKFAEATMLNESYQPFIVDHLLADQQSLTVDNVTLQCLSVAGHSPDSLCFYWSEQKLVFSGDTLMQSCRGRTDLPGGNEQQLLTNLRNKLLTLPADTQVLPGHGGITTIQQEKSYYLV